MSQERLIDRTFGDLCTRAVEIHAASPDAGEHEPYFLEVLRFLKAHPEGRGTFVTFFAEKLTNADKAYCAIIEFCMHELRWPELYQAAIAVATENPDSLTLYWMDSIQLAFSDDWYHGAAYEYYSDIKRH